MSNEANNLFQGVANSPFHISVGAVVVNANGSIGCHHFQSHDLHESEGKGDLYQLMRETLQPDETLEASVNRGLQEEFGAIGTIVSYLGSIKSHYPLPKSGMEVEKTTIYFQVALDSINQDLRTKDDIESKSEILWIQPEELKRLFIEQGKRYDRTDHDESSVIENYLKYGKS